VVAVGPGRITDDGKRIPMDLKVGDMVIYAKYGGSEIKIDDIEMKWSIRHWRNDWICTGLEYKYHVWGARAMGHHYANFEHLVGYSFQTGAEKQ